jgi:hypothetical protein
MPGEVQVKRASEINAPSGAQTAGMIRMNAITDMSDQICGTGNSRGSNSVVFEAKSYPVMIAKPHSASDVHHHGEEGIVPSRL